MALIGNSLRTEILQEDLVDVHDHDVLLILAHQHLRLGIELLGLGFDIVLAHLPLRLLQSGNFSKRLGSLGSARAVLRRVFVLRRSNSKAEHPCLPKSGCWALLWVGIFDLKLDFAGLVFVFVDRVVEVVGYVLDSGHLCSYSPKL